MARVRIDPIQHALHARAYLTDIDPTLPLEEMVEPYITIGTITIADDTAYVQGVHGRLERAVIDETFEQLVRDYGIERMTWRRQYPDGRVERCEKRREELTPRQEE
jgi:hypothetical protein